MDFSIVDMCSSLPSFWRASQAITRAPARQDPTILIHHALQFPIRGGGEADIDAERLVAAIGVDVYVTKN
jgi:hypothetical protein